MRGQPLTGGLGPRVKFPLDNSRLPKSKEKKKIGNGETFPPFLILRENQQWRRWRRCPLPHYLSRLTGSSQFHLPTDVWCRISPSSSSGRPVVRASCGAGVRAPAWWFTACPPPQASAILSLGLFRALVLEIMRIVNPSSIISDFFTDLYCFLK